MTLRHIFPAVFAIALSGCSGNGSGLSQRDSAEALNAEIETAMTQGNYSKAITDIDSFSRTFPLQTDIRRKLLNTRAKAAEGLAIQSIPRLDAGIAVLQAGMDSMQNDFVSVQPATSLPPYLVHKGCKGTVDSSPRIQARVNTGTDATDTPWVLAVGTGRDIGLNRLVINTAQGATYTIPVNECVGGMLASLRPEQIDGLGRQLAANNDKIAQVTASGSKGSVKIPVSDAESRGIAAAWQLSTQRDSLRKMLIEREKTERILQMSRDKAANSL